MHHGGDRAHIGLDHDPPADAADLRHLVDHEHGFEKAKAGAAILLRDRHPEEAGIRQRLHIVPWILLRTVDLRRPRRDRLARQGARTLLKVLLGNAERHDVLTPVDGAAFAPYRAKPASPDREMAARRALPSWRRQNLHPQDACRHI